MKSAGSPLLTARLTAWLWLVVYIAVPVLMVIMFIREEREQPRRAASSIEPAIPLPRLLAVALLIDGVVMVAVGIALFTAPAPQRVLWAWQLTPLTARSVAAWLVAFGLVALLGVRSNDLTNLRISAWASGLLAILDLPMPSNASLPRVMTSWGKTR